MKLNNILSSFRKTATKLDKFIDEAHAKADANDAAIAKLESENDCLMDEVSQATNARNHIQKFIGTGPSEAAEDPQG